jgi:hypothetical protein
VAISCCVLASLAELVALRLSGTSGAVALAPQALALAPIGAWHDDRWILVFASSWPAAGLEIGAALCIRAVLMALMVRALWPERPPRWGAALRRAAVGEAILVLAMSPWATLSFLGGIVSLSWLVFAGIAGAAATAMLLCHVGIAPRFAQRLPSLRAIAWSAVAFVLSGVEAAVVVAAPGWWQLVPVLAAGVTNAWCWRQLIVALARPRAPRPRRLEGVLAPLVLILGVPALLLAGAAGFGTHVETAIPHRVVRSARPRRGQRVVLVVNGFMSDWNGGRPTVSVPGHFSAQYSYRGQSRRGRPLAYSSAATTAPLAVLARRLARQVRRLARLSGRRVDLLAVSEGTLVVWRYLTSTARLPVRMAVLTSPLVRPDRDAYPPPGRTGAGMLGEAEARGLLALLDAEAPKAHLSANMAMVRSLMNDPALYRRTGLCPLGSVAVRELVPLAAAAVSWPGSASGVPTAIIPAVHAGVLRHPGELGVVRSLLSGAPMPSDGAWGPTFRALSDIFDAWEAPTLPLAQMPATAGAGLLGGARCR